MVVIAPNSPQALKLRSLRGLRLASLCGPRRETASDERGWRPAPQSTWHTPSAKLPCDVVRTCWFDRTKWTSGREPACLASSEAGLLPGAVLRGSVCKDPSPSPSKQFCRDRPPTPFVSGPASRGWSLACVLPAHTRDVPPLPGIVHPGCRDGNQLATHKAGHPGNRYRLRWSAPVPEFVPDSRSQESSVAASFLFWEGPRGKVQAPK